MTEPTQGPDPWKSFRGVMAGTLILEAIVVLLALPVVGAVGGLRTIWAVADILNALMAIPNLIALAVLSPVVFKVTRDYYAGGVRD